MTDSQTSQKNVASPGTTIADTFSEVLAEAQPVLNRMADRISEGAHAVTKQSKEAACEAEHRLTDGVRHARFTAEHYIQHAPFKSVLIAAATGAATALMVSWLMRSRQQR